MPKRRATAGPETLKHRLMYAPFEMDVHLKSSRRASLSQTKSSSAMGTKKPGHEFHGAAQNETTDEHRSVLLTRQSLAGCQGFSSACSWERTHPASCVPAGHSRHAGSWKRALPGTEPPRSPRLCGEAFWL